MHTDQFTTILNPVKISAVIITYNEELSIGRCIDSLQQVADEILVVDSYSTDKTKEICLRKGVRFVEHPFHSHIEQKNFALREAHYDHILSLDADEYLSEELTLSILGCRQNWDGPAYQMKRLSTYSGKWIRHGDWYPDRKIRLLDRRLGHWNGYNPHDKIYLHNGYKAKPLNGDILHIAYKNSNDAISKIQCYSEIYARNQAGRRRSSVLKIVLSASFAFVRSYIFRMGFLDGFEGLMVSVAVSNHTLYKYAKLYELNREAKESRVLPLSRSVIFPPVIHSNEGQGNHYSSAQTKKSV